jgi:hypothetical protein
MKILIVVYFLLLLASCKREVESPHLVAENYCNCIDSLFTNSKDSLVDLNKCNYIHSSSRFINIWINSDGINYSEATKDSAAKFALLVRNIEDSICFDRIDHERIKKQPHVKY